MNISDSSVELVFNSKSQQHVVVNGESIDSTEQSTRHKSSSAEIKFNRKRRKLSEKQLQEFTELYSTTIVHDFGKNDDYHLSEKERESRNQFYKAFAKLRNTKSKFKTLNGFVNKYRLCLECLKVVAENNGVYAPEKFYDMVLRGKIKVNGLQFPIYDKKDKKNINWDFVAEFIASGKDVSELDKLLNNINDSDDVDEILSDDEIREVSEDIEADETSIFMPFYDDDSDVNRDDIATVPSKKETKELIRMAPQLVRSVKEVTKRQRRRQNTQSRLQSFVYEMQESDFEYLERMDAKRGYESSSDIPKFKGDIMNRKDYKKYLLSLQNYEENNITENYHGSMKTKAEIREIEIKNLLEENGWNVRKLYKDGEKEKKLKKAYKANKKQEERLKKKLMAIQNKNSTMKNKYGKKVTFNAKGKKKKKKQESD